MAETLPADPTLVPLPAIVPGRDAEPALDARALFDEGLAALRRLSRGLWTDHNVHDPGITMLELLGYALTELGYRHTLPLEDLLAAPVGIAQQFHAPREVLPNRPLTEADWRKWLVDLVDVKNAWIEPAEDVQLWADLRLRELGVEPPAHEARAVVPLRGLYRVRIEFMEAVTTQAQRDDVLRSARQAIEAARNLCEDVIELRAVRAQFFALCAEVDLNSAADVTEVAAQLLFSAGELLAPPLLTYSLDEMLARGHTLPEIFSGPPMSRGFIDDAELQATALPAELRLSDLIGVLSDVNGVRSLRELLLNPIRRTDEDDDSALDGDPTRIVGEAETVANSWRVPVRNGRLPRLSLAHGRLVFSKRGLPVAGFNIAQMPAAVATRLAVLREQARVRVERPASTANPSLPSGRARPLAAWRSVQRDFPELYGIGEAGLGDRHPPSRHAQALQLKGWLLFFDQLMADQLALLAQARRRLSVSAADLDDVAARFRAGSTARHVLASQLVDSIVGHGQLYAPGVDAARLSDLAEDAASARRRQRALLDHLLARVAEDFTDYAAAMASAFGRDDDRLIGDASGFMKDVATLVAHRAGGFVQRSPTAAGVWNTGNVSGLERRIGRLLGILNVDRRNLGLASYDTYAELDSSPGDEFRWRVRHAVSGAIVLSSSMNHATPEAARAEMVLAIERAQRPEGYQRRRDRLGRHYFNIIGEGGAVIGRRIQYFDDEAAMEAAIAALLSYLLEHYSGEGLFVVEHLLLRPQQPGDARMRICADPGCDDCTDFDPYSYRIRVVLPAYAGRFQDMGFRRFTEDLIRRETPAHILPTICWVSAEHMRQFEAAWRPWLELAAGVSRTGRAEKLQALLDALDEIKNVYPVRNLFDCTGDDAKPPFLLGKTALGRGPGAA